MGKDITCIFGNQNDEMENELYLSYVCRTPRFTVSFCLERYNIVSLPLILLRKTPQQMSKTSHVNSWRTNGNQIILMADYNEDIEGNKIKQ